MPAPRAKPLAVATCISDLNRHAENVKISIKGDLQCRQYCKSLADIFKKADAKFQDGDEENAYILFMRVLHIFEAIKKTYEYQKHKKVFNEIINTGNIMLAMERAEDLSCRLRLRYKQLEADRISLSSAAGKQQSVSRKEVKETHSDTKAKPPEEPKVPQKYEPQDKKGGAQLGENFFNSLPDVPDDSVDGKLPEAMTPKGDPWIVPHDLYNLLKSQNHDSILIMDTRPPAEFSASRIKTNAANVINIKEELLKPGASINSIERRLPKDVWQIWVTRASKDHVIIMDHDSTRGSLTSSDSHIQVLKDAIFSSAAGARCEPRLLHAGFNGWQLYYPSLCTDPFYKKSKPNHVASIPDPSKLLSDLSYPSLFGIKDNERSSDARPSQGKSIESTENDVNDANPKTGGKEDDVFSNLRRQIAEASGVRLTTDASSIRHTNANANVPPAGITKPGELDNRPRTGSQGSTYLKNNKTEGRTRSELDAAKQLGRYEAIHVDFKDVSSSDKDGKNFSATLPSQLPGMRIANDSKKESESRNEGRLPTGVEKKTTTIIDAGNSAGRSGSLESDGSTKDDLPNVAKRSLDPESKNLDSNSNHSVSMDKGHIRGTNQGGAYFEAGSLNRDARMPGVGGQRREPSGNVLREGRSSPIKGDVRKPVTLGDTPGSVNPKPGQFSAMSHLPPNGQNWSTQQTDGPGVSSGGNPTAQRSLSTAPAPKSNDAPKVEFSSNTFPRPGDHARVNRVPAANDSKANPPAANIPPSRLPAPNTSHSDPPATTSTHNAVQNGLKPQPTGASQSVGNGEKGKSLERRGKVHSTEVIASGTRNAGRIPTEPRDGPEPTKSGTNTSGGLPHGWEKTIDRRTGRVYFIDHTTKSTHWELPPDFYASRERDDAQKQKRKAPEPPSATEPSEATLKRSLSTPNLADMAEDKARPKPFRPVVDRSSKPSEPKSQLVDRSTKPLSKTRLESLSPVYGSKGRNLTGLKNLGNTCYMNAVIQCLSNTIPLASYFNSGQYLKHLNSKSMNRRPEEVAKELGFLIKVLWSGQYRSVSPTDFKAAIGRFASQFEGYTQQDAHEFLMYFMDGIHEDTNQIKKRTPMVEQNNDNIPDKVSSLKAWRDYTKNNESIIVDLFQGQFKSTVCCKTCGQKSVTFDVFSCLPLELTSPRSCTLDDCIRAFTKPEMIGGNNSWKCTRCKAYREATKTIEFWKLPPVVIVQLKRFSSDGMWHNKLQTKVDFPISELDMRRYLVSSDSQHTVYGLFGVVNHYGSFESGHYTSYCLNQKSWYTYDDSSVTSLELSRVKTPAAYLLFYTAVDFKEYL